MQSVTSRIRYAIPSCFTFASVLCGCYVVVSALRGFLAGSDPSRAAEFFIRATQAIGIAIILDNIDGRLARKIGATTQFGTELDSLADVLTFGGATAILVYLWTYNSGIDLAVGIVAFIFVACGAARLARSNLHAHALKTKSPDIKEERYFVGLPIPAASGLVAAIIYYSSAPIAQGLQGKASQLPNSYLLAIVVVLSLLMISTFPYSKLKIRYQRQQSLPAFLNFLVFPTIAALIATVVLLGVRWLVLAAATLYVVHGPLCAIWFSRRSQSSHEPVNRRINDAEHSRAQEGFDSQLLP
jgi:CDP-diacylglycerol--serine O-phosphatidyltransferase